MALLGTPASADTTYYYTGNPFTTIDTATILASPFFTAVPKSQRCHGHKTHQKRSARGSEAVCRRARKFAQLHKIQVLERKKMDEDAAYRSCATASFAP
jgi:hypothetical protein